MSHVVTQTRALNRSDLKTIAARQKVVIFRILLYLAAVIGQFVVPPDMLLLLRVGVVAVVVVATVFVFMLATNHHGLFVSK